ncbi:MAG: FtsW/RodA/SpoVE family cell cycle protein [Salinivirgaceae bacterium]|nr:FtsW/RodA/SpoVE family cell cycle protein [Salinivirgaceae bacterium]
MKKGIFDILQGDKGVWVIVFLLSIISLLAVYSSTGTLAYKRFGGNTQYFLMRHFMFMVISFIIMYFVHMVRYTMLLRLSKLFFYISIPLLIYTMVGGLTLNQASRWITVPFINLSFQTSDFAKLSLMLYLAALIASRQQTIGDFNKGFRRLIIPVVFICGLILPSDFSTAALLFVSAVVLMYIGRVKIQHLLGMAGVAVVALTLFILVAMVSDSDSRIGTWKNRIENFVDDEGGGNFQSNQAKIAIASGGLTGKGLGHSVQRNILPHPYSDFIFAIVIEETGFAGAFLLIGLYLILFFRTAAIVRKCKRVGPALMVAGMMILMVIQAFVHMAVSVGIFPVTGQTLPFVSMGGTSLLISSVQMGIILSVSRSLQQDNKKRTSQIQNTEPDENDQSDI